MKSSMYRRVFLIVASATGWFATGHLQAQEKEQPAKVAEEQIDEHSIASEEETLQHVPTIIKIEHVIQTSEPPNLVITAYGKVPTAGWKQVQLIRRIYIVPPSDGIWEYDMLGLRPTGPAAQVVTTVRAKNVWENYDKQIKGVRVYGIGRGAKELRFPSAEKR